MSPEQTISREFTSAPVEKFQQREVYTEDDWRSFKAGLDKAGASPSEKTMMVRMAEMYPDMKITNIKHMLHGPGGIQPAPEWANAEQQIPIAASMDETINARIANAVFQAEAASGKTPEAALAAALEAARQEKEKKKQQDEALKRRQKGGTRPSSPGQTTEPVTLEVDPQPAQTVRRHRFGRDGLMGRGGASRRPNHARARQSGGDNVDDGLATETQRRLAAKALLAARAEDSLLPAERIRLSSGLHQTELSPDVDELTRRAWQTPESAEPLIAASLAADEVPGQGVSTASIPDEVPEVWDSIALPEQDAQTTGPHATVEQSADTQPPDENPDAAQWAEQPLAAEPETELEAAILALAEMAPESVFPSAEAFSQDAVECLDLMLLGDEQPRYLRIVAEPAVDETTLVRYEEAQQRVLQRLFAVDSAHTAIPRLTAGVDTTELTVVAETRWTRLLADPDVPEELTLQLTVPAAEPPPRLQLSTAAEMSILNSDESFSDELPAFATERLAAADLGPSAVELAAEPRPRQRLETVAGGSDRSDYPALPEDLAADRGLGLLTTVGPDLAPDSTAVIDRTVKPLETQPRFPLRSRNRRLIREMPLTLPAEQMTAVTIEQAVEAETPTISAGIGSPLDPAAERAFARDLESAPGISHTDGQ